MHKRYCSAPPTHQDQERLDALMKAHEDLVEDIPDLTWRRLCQMSDQDPSIPSDMNLDAIEERLTSIVYELNDEETSGTNDSDKKFPFYDSTWTFRESLDEIKALPKILGGLCFSWSCMGIMDRETGELQYLMNAANMETAQVRQMATISRKPTRDDLWQMIYGCMARPRLRNACCIWMVA